MSDEDVKAYSLTTSTLHSSQCGRFRSVRLVTGVVRNRCWARMSAVK